MKKQVVVVHGGDTFATYEEYLSYLRAYEIDIELYTISKNDWKRGLRDKLGIEYEVILPSMPNKFNAQFDEWKIWFGKIIPYLNDRVILVGHSLGGAFLAKYLSLAPFPKKIAGVFLVSAVYDKDSEGYGIASFSVPDKLDMQCDEVYLYHSKDDPIVPFSTLSKFQSAIPGARARVLNDRKHINQEEFPELVNDIISLNT